MTYFSALFGTTGATSSATGGGWIGTQASSSTTTGYTGYTNSVMQTQMLQAQALGQMQGVYLQQWQADQLPGGRALASGEYELPDGAKLVIDSLGNYHVLDEDAKVVYRANRVREFNPYINASDLLEAFIEEVGKYDGVDQSEVLNLPIEAFINWIILQAAKRDGDPLDNLPSVESALPTRSRLPALQDEAARLPNTGVMIE